ncbi:MAG: hypothetical protein U0930_25065 [Pirellulales bacterium]
MTDPSQQLRLDSLKHNREAWDRMVQADHALTRPAKDDELANPLATVDSVGWLGKSIAGWNVLCLAAGGGRHGPLYAAAGATLPWSTLAPPRRLRIASSLKPKTFNCAPSKLRWTI